MLDHRRVFAYFFFFLSTIYYILRLGDRFAYSSSHPCIFLFFPVYCTILYYIWRVVNRFAYSSLHFYLFLFLFFNLILYMKSSHSICLLILLDSVISLTYSSSSYVKSSEINPFANSLSSNHVFRLRVLQLHTIYEINYIY